ncbi:hypothetical protein B566_EDAN011286 [Ephemera danica]|nr:hypothetical protein B566_EDAN011286 [Ephemera danica]
MALIPTFCSGTGDSLGAGTAAVGGIFPSIHPAFRTQVAGLKYFPPPPRYGDIQFPERPKLKFVDKVPQIPANIRPPKMQKRLDFMRGPELVHNFLIHQQYGIIALHGGRMKWGHFEMVRLTLGRRIDGQGQRMGGGKGAIDHYVTPVKAERVIVEVAGVCEFDEVKPMLEEVAHKLPFAAKVVSHKSMLKEKEEEQLKEKLNTNPFTFEYVIRNKMGGSHNWISPYDKKWFGKYQ